jgi:hypothetical protein
MLETLASLLGYSKPGMVMRYVHPGEARRNEAVKNLKAVNAAREIAECEKRKAQERVGTKTGTIALNPAEFSEEQTEGKSNRVH